MAKDFVDLALCQDSSSSASDKKNAMVRKPYECDIDRALGYDKINQIDNMGFMWSFYLVVVRCEMTGNSCEYIAVRIGLLVWYDLKIAFIVSE